MGRLIRLAACLPLGLALCIPSSGIVHARRTVPVTVAMGYVANIQFAPFYVAQAKGYYRQAGLDVRFRYGIEPDLLRLASLGKVDFVNSGGDEVLAAGAHGLGVKYVLTQYTRFPSAVFWLQRTGIRRLRDLRGRTVGIPGPFGASYVGLLALLRRAGIPQSSLKIESIGFNQVASVAGGKVDAAVGYAMNEPVFLRHQGLRVGEFDIFHWVNIAGAGIAVGNGEIARRPATVRAFVRATIRGMDDTLRNPDEAFRITLRVVPKLRAQSRVQRAILQRSLDFWRPEPGHPLGWIDPLVWNRTARLLYAFKQIPRPVSAASYYTNRFTRRP